MATAVQLSFNLRTSPNVKTVHLLGSWDGYKSQLPLSRDPGASKPGGWKGTFRFQGATLKLGQRYWYYYIIDGYHVSHDPAKEYTVEPTTGRKLNILDVPGGKGGAKPSAASVAQGRALSPGKIQHPRPTKAYASQKIRQADYTRDPGSDVDDLADRLEGLLGSYRGSTSPDSSGFSSSPSSSDLGSDRSSPSSLSSLSSGSCRCERYGITRSGAKVKLDCGGSRCGSSGSSDSSSGCSSDSDSSDGGKPRYSAAAIAAAKKKAAAAAATSRPAAKTSRPAARGRR